MDKASPSAQFTLESQEMADTLAVRQIFPTEIWLEITKQMMGSRPEDLDNLAHASPYFYHLLCPQRPAYLFSKVLPILLPYSEISESREVVQNNKWEHRNFQTQWMVYSPRLKLREVCKSWKVAVDRYYQNHADHLETNWHNVYRDFQASGQLTHYKFSKLSPKWVDNFMLTFDTTHGSTGKNPFISRSVSFEDYGNEEEYKDFEFIYFNSRHSKELEWTSITRFLETFGHHLWYCDILLENTYVSNAVYNTFLQKWLELMPNLKVLNVWNGALQCEHLQTFPTKNAVGKLPMPKLRDVQLIKVQGLPGATATQLVKSNSHVQKLEMNPVINSFYSYEGMCWNKFSSLESLTLQFTSFDEIVTLGQYSLPLKTLELGYAGESDYQFGAICRYVRWSRVFGILEKWSKTLTSLTLNLPRPRSSDEFIDAWSDFQTLSLDMPYIRNLKITLWDFLPIDMLLPMDQCLENLHVVIKTGGVSNSLSVVAQPKVDYRERLPYNLSDSNIWSVFNRLKTFVVSMDSWPCCALMYPVTCLEHQPFDTVLSTRKDFEKKYFCLCT